ncbi:tRNA (adenosine(37)-N6)-threonylcarbamoyltransferase complex ATPase subunit type 1 TsaE [Frigoribacterium salinisoli]
MERLGRALGEQLGAGDLVVLTGPLGAGKTTLTRGIGAGMGVRGQVASPTFVLARTHPREGAAPLVHVDAYRLSGPDELDDLDLDFDGSVVVVEWGAGLLDGVAEQWLDVVVERRLGGGDPEAPVAPTDQDALDDDVAVGGGDEPRHVTVTGHGPRWAGLRLPGGPSVG